MPRRIGELLVEFKLISPEQLKEAMAAQERTGEKLGDIIIAKNFVTSEDLEHLLSRQLSTPSINLRQYNPPPEIVALINEKFMRKHYVVPVEIHDNVLTVAMANPNDYAVLDELRFMTGKKIAPVVSATFEIKRKIRDIFPSSEKWEETLGDSTEKTIEYITPQAQVREENLEEALHSAEDAPTVKIVNSVILAAIGKNATHIHLEPREKNAEIKLRVNGLLERIYTAPKEQARNLMIRLKVLAGIDILQRRVPLEGYFRVRSEDKYFDIDMHTFPVSEGEHAVLAFQQLFSKEDLRLENLGFAPKVIAQYQAVIATERGLIIYVGPPDSGKTSTIYATLNALKSPNRRAVTYENPIKNKLADIEQAEPNVKAGLTYEAGLRALVRHDIDYLMVGDMTSRETIHTALEAALGNTLVLGRMVFNHTTGAIPRILEHGVPPFLLYSSLKGILGQRLVRRLCTHCLESYDPPPPVKIEIAETIGKENAKLYYAVGCKHCGNTGYQGRIGIYEFLVPDMEVQSLILSQADQGAIDRAVALQGFRNLLHDGMEKAVEGLTTYEDVRAAL